MYNFKANCILEKYSENGKKETTILLKREHKSD